MLLSDPEKATLAEIAHRLGRKALKDVGAAAKPDTLLAWYRKLIAKKFDGSKFRKSVGRPPVEEHHKTSLLQEPRVEGTSSINRKRVSGNGTLLAYRF